MNMHALRVHQTVIRKRGRFNLSKCEKNEKEENEILGPSSPTFKPCVLITIAVIKMESGEGKDNVSSTSLAIHFS